MVNIKEQKSIAEFRNSHSVQIVFSGTKNNLWCSNRNDFWPIPTSSHFSH
jgi:hypothetical protein